MYVYHLKLNRWLKVSDEVCEALKKNGVIRDFCVYRTADLNFIDLTEGGDGDAKAK